MDKLTIPPLAKCYDKQTPDIFNKMYIESKQFYLFYFKAIPCIATIDPIEIPQALEYIQDLYKDNIIETYYSRDFDHEEGKWTFFHMLILLNNKVLIELDEQCTQVLFSKTESDFAYSILNKLSEFKIPDKKEDFEINIITRRKEELVLKRLDIKPTHLDINVCYNDDFKEIDTLIRDRLSNHDDKGIILLHGLPGTGKTTYLRYLVGGLKKRVLFVSPSVASNLMNPDFIDLLINNPNSILVIEDAENILMDRKHNSDSSVSNLLNLSDGLLSDCLGVQIICTFNSSVHLLDSALMRKGRLIAKYEFGKLSTGKAQALSKQLGFDTIISEPMTLAEVANQNDKQYEAERIEVKGFSLGK